MVEGELERRRDLTPRIKPSVYRLFGQYSRWYLGRSFRAVRLARADRPPEEGDRPLVVFGNHASWWDPLVAITLAGEVLAGRQHFSPIDQAALEKYKFFEWLGFYGVEQHSRRGAASFLRTSRAILGSPDSVIWITPQGSFEDVRRRPVRFEPGLAHLADGRSRCLAVPVAGEYVFGEEKLPEVWMRFGAAIETDSFRELSTVERTAALERSLEAVQDRLAKDVIDRRREAYEVIVAGRGGMGGVYEMWRRAKAWARGRTFQPEHGEERL